MSNMLETWNELPIRNLQGIYYLVAAFVAIWTTVNSKATGIGLAITFAGFYLLLIVLGVVFAMFATVMQDGALSTDLFQKEQQLTIVFIGAALLELWLFVINIVYTRQIWIGVPSAAFSTLNGVNAFLAGFLPSAGENLFFNMILMPSLRNFFSEKMDTIWAAFAAIILTGIIASLTHIGAYGGLGGMVPAFVSAAIFFSAMGANVQLFGNWGWLLNEVLHIGHNWVAVAARIVSFVIGGA